MAQARRDRRRPMAARRTFTGYSPAPIHRRMPIDRTVSGRLGIALPLAPAPTGQSVLLALAIRLAMIGPQRESRRFHAGSQTRNPMTSGSAWRRATSCRRRSRMRARCCMRHSPGPPTGWSFARFMTATGAPRRAFRHSIRTSRVEPESTDRFFRTGSSGGWRSVLSPAQAGRIERTHAGTMARLGYLPPS